MGESFAWKCWKSSILFSSCSKLYPFHTQSFKERISTHIFGLQPPLLLMLFWLSSTTIIFIKIHFANTNIKVYARSFLNNKFFYFTVARRSLHRYWKYTCSRERDFQVRPCTLVTEFSYWKICLTLWNEKCFFTASHGFALGARMVVLALNVI